MSEMILSKVTSFWPLPSARKPLIVGIVSGLNPQYLWAIKYTASYETNQYIALN